HESIDPYAHTLAIHHLLTLRCALSRDYQEARTLAEESLARANPTGILYAVAFGLLWVGSVMVAEKDFEAGIEKVQEGMRAFSDAGSKANSELYSYHAVAAYLEARLIDEGIPLADEMVARARAGGVRVFEADLNRLKGELLLAGEGPSAAAEAAFRQAIA